MHKVVILGCGFAGLRVATILANSGEFEIILVNSENFLKLLLRNYQRLLTRNPLAAYYHKCRTLQLYKFAS